jgi:hypothetical protein
MNNLTNAVLEEIKDNIKGYTEEEAASWVENDAWCENGSVSGLIYYTDTVAFFDKHEAEILELANEWDYSPCVVDLGMEGFKNQMSWFAFEALKDQVFQNNLLSIDFEEEEA